MPAQQLEIPKSRAMSSSTAALLVTMPACDDRVAADLRTRVLDAGWVSNARLCLELRSWMVANNLSVLEASRKIGVPHITADVMQRLSECRRPIGGTSAGVWQELLNLVVDVEVARRITVSAAAAYHGRPVTAKPAPLPQPTTTATPSLADLRAAIISEIGRPRKPGVRTVKTAQMVLDIAAEYSPLRGSKHANKLGLPQAYALASALAEDEKLALAAATHTPAVQVDDRDRDRWYFRLEAYAPRIAEIRAATQPASAPAPVAPTHKTAAPRDVKFVGRPRLLPGGAELSATITRMVQETIRIGPTDDLWSAGVAALNGDA